MSKEGERSPGGRSLKFPSPPSSATGGGAAGCSGSEGPEQPEEGKVGGNPHFLHAQDAGGRSRPQKPQAGFSFPSENSYCVLGPVLSCCCLTAGKVRLCLPFRGRGAAPNSEGLGPHGNSVDVCGVQLGQEHRLRDSSPGGLTEGGGKGLRNPWCHQSGKVPRRRRAEDPAHSIHTPLARTQHGRCGGGRGSSESRQERGGAAISGASTQARPLWAPDGGTAVRAPPGR